MSFSVLIVFLVFTTIFNGVSSEIVAFEDSLLVDCGSSSNTSIGNRLFRADQKASSESIFIVSNSSIDQLFKTVRIFTEASDYSFRVPKQGRYWIRLYFFPFSHPIYNLSDARFSVSTQSNVSLVKEVRIEEGFGVTIKEYSVNVTERALILSFVPVRGSFAFVSAIEIVAQPSELSFPEGALETIFRLNMGNESVSPANDSLYRSWLADGAFLMTNSTRFVSRLNLVSSESEIVAPTAVYGTATEFDIDERNNVVYANLSWKFTVAPRFDYFFRFHFCNLGGEESKNPLFSLYVNSDFVSSYSSASVGVPSFLDALVKVSHGEPLVVSVGPRSAYDSHSIAFLNGLEIMKLIGSEDRTVLVSTRIKTSSDRKFSLVITVVVVIAATIIAAIGVLFVVLVRRRRRTRGRVGGEVGTGTGTTGLFSGAYRFPLSAIREATEDFSEERVIGIGGFGKVYKGILKENGSPNPVAVAIKRGALSSESNQGLSEFRTEIEMLSQFRHRHLVSLIGYCDERGEMIIIYEHVENGTLRDRLYGSLSSSSDLSGLTLTFRQRLQICIGSARALHYLHTGTAKTIIHRDVKSANILLDHNLMAKVADFGLSKAGPGLDESHVTTMVKGSFGYLDPEYLTLQRLTEKSDVYSFGVVLLEVLCGRAVVDPSLPRDRVNLVDWAVKCSNSGLLGEAVDPRLAGQVSPESLAKFWETVEKCLAERGALRPSMGDVLWNLESVLRLQGDERVVLERLVSEVRSEAADISSVCLGDLAGVSMSKVFAQMVKDDMR